MPVHHVTEAHAEHLHLSCRKKPTWWLCKYIFLYHEVAFTEVCLLKRLPAHI